VRDELAGLLAAPVAPAVTLTDEEREALLSGADALYGIGHDAEAATLRSLLARAAKEATP
jgi:predicted DNA-binding transcriptional regulator YafY